MKCNKGHEMVYQPSQSQYWCPECKTYKSKEPLLRGVNFDKPEAKKTPTE